MEIINEQNTTRFVWLDWMKTLAIYFIIAGHCWVPGNEFLYVFNVPAFFILSGFLSKKEENTVIFWKKTWWNLIVPMCLYFVITTLVQFGVQIMKGTFEVNYLYKAPLLGLIGMQGQNYEAGGLKAMWFVYTLIICKMLLQYSPNKYNTIYLAVLNVVFLCASWVLHHYEVVCYNSIVNVLLAMPFYTIGFSLRQFRDKFSNLSMYWMPLIVTIGILGVYYCGVHNDTVMLYKCSYGSNLFLCIIGAICGTAAIYGLSMPVKRYVYNAVRIVGGGTLVILGLHFVIIQTLNQFLRIHGSWLYFESFIILITFVPIILFVEKHLPLLYGKYRNK